MILNNTRKTTTLAARCIHVLVVCSMVLVTTPLHAQKGTINLDLKNVSLVDLVRTMSKLTGRNFLIDNNVSGNITLIAPTPVSTDEAWRIFLSILSVRNLALERSGQVYKIINAKEAVQYDLPVVYGTAAYSSSEEMIVRLIPLEHVKVGELEAFLKNFKGKNGNIYTFSSANMLVIADTSKNINRMLRLIQRLDKPPVSSTMEVFEVQNASATEMVDLINKVYGISSAEQPTSRRARNRKKKAEADGEYEFETNAIADDRTNKIIFMGPSGEIRELIEFIKRFDKPVTAGSGQIHVHYLRNADATSISETLGRLTQGAGKTSSKKKGADKDTDVAEFEGGIKITADKETNSLIIVSSPSDFAKLQNLIQKLDRPRQQVYVEAAVVEVSLGNNFDFGFNVLWGQEQTYNGSDGASYDGMVFSGAGLGGPSISDPLQIASLNGVFGGAFATLADGLPPIGVIVRALQTSDSANILSTPHLLTSDNQEAEIIVGDNVPFITGQSATSGGNVLTSVDRKDVGLTLRITPQINESDRIKLDLYQEISSVSTQQPQGVDVNKQGLITRKRSAKTTVVANDRQTIVIGGLISNEHNESRSKIPFLGDIPLLGRLFRSTTKSKRKTNLLIFLTPRIVRDSNDYDAYALERVHQFWEVHQRAPAKVGFREYFDENVAGWRDYEAETEQAALFEEAAVDTTIPDAMFYGTEDTASALPLTGATASAVSTTSEVAPAAERVTTTP